MQVDPHSSIGDIKILFNKSCKFFSHSGIVLL